MSQRSITFLLLGFVVGVWAATAAGGALALFIVGAGLGIFSLLMHHSWLRAAALGFFIGVVRLALPIGQTDVTTQTVSQIQQAAVQRIQQAVPYPANGLVAGILFGFRDDIPRDLTNAMRSAGLSHLLAVSGFNVTILAVSFAHLAKYFFGPRLRAALTILIVAGYVVLCGSGPPILRAGLMGGIAALVHTSGRAVIARRTLLAAAVLLLLIDPFALRFDVGFQLSLAATFGLLTLSPLIQRLVTKVPSLFGMRDAGVASVAASLSTLPVVVAVFGVAPLYGVIANMLAAPLIPPLMLLGALALLGGSSIVGTSVGTLTAYLVELLSAIARTTERLPHAAIQLSTISALALMTAALLGIFAALVLRKSVHSRRAARPLLL
ncbi:MAG: ComEC/Rec2 family competence protein [bacterium]|nr:ComEC/Rec2 family competence protein [bacterium]